MSAPAVRPTVAMLHAQADAEQAWRRFCRAAQNGSAKACEAADAELRSAWRRFDRAAKAVAR